MKPDRWKRPQLGCKSSCLGKMVLGFSGFIMVVSLAAGSAWSLERPGVLSGKADASSYFPHKALIIEERSAPLSVNHSSADSTPLLETVRHTPQALAADNETRHHAGTVAISGLTPGLRYALVPAGASPIQG